MKIAFIVEFPTQFEVPFYQYITHWIKEQRIKFMEQAAGINDAGRSAEDWDFHVIYNFTDQKDYHDFELGKKVGWGFNLYQGYPYFIANKNNRLGSVDEILSREQYDFVILNGYKNSYKGLPELCKSKDIPIALRIDSVLYNLTPIQKILKRIYLPFAYRNFNHFFAVGSETKKFLTWLGINPQKINYFSYATHDEWFKENASDNPQINELRLKLGIKNERVLLSVAKFIERESPWDILNAFKLLNDPNTALVLVGDGRDREALSLFAAKNKHLKIIFTGYVPYTTLPYYYGLTDIFIHAAKNEPWGVSVQEAIASGCTVITSNKVGSSTDLIREGCNGFIYQYKDVVQLKSVIVQGFKLDPILKEKTNLEVLQNWGYSGIWEQIKTGAISTLNKNK